MPKEKLILEDIKTWLKDATKVAIKEAEDLTRKGRLKLEIFSLNRKIEKQTADLGRLVYALMTKEKTPDILGNEKIGEYINLIAKLEKELKAQEYELRRLQKRR